MFFSKCWQVSIEKDLTVLFVAWKSRVLCIIKFALDRNGGGGGCNDDRTLQFVVTNIKYQAPTLKL